MATSKFIGSGILFPIEINPETGRPDFVNDMRLIISDLKIRMNWPRNQRYFNETFGERIHELLEEPNDNVAKSLLRTFAKECIEDEPRVILMAIKIHSYDLWKVNLIMTVRIRNTKIEDTFIFPYYKQLP